MCHEPFLRMCVRKINGPPEGGPHEYGASLAGAASRRPENHINTCLPRASTRSIVRPHSGASASTRISCGYTDSKRVTTRPASARCSVRAVRWMVSPSGIELDVALGDEVDFGHRLGRAR